MRPIRLNLILASCVLVLCVGHAKQRKYAGDDWTSLCIEKHNNLRSKHHVEPLVGDEKLSELANEVVKKYAGLKYSELVDSNNQSYGMNHLSFPANARGTCKSLVSQWYNEIANYDFNDSSITDRSRSFTQIVWRSTKNIGCAKHRSATSESMFHLVCLYFPPGNIVGDEDENVLHATQRRWQDECISAHNEKRAMHQAEPLVLNRALYDLAKIRATQLTDIGRVAFQVPDYPPLGENIAWHRNPKTSCKTLVESWYAGITFYQFGPTTTRDPRANQFTAIVWRNSKSIGCARVVSAKPRGGVYLVCKYDPSGNIFEQYEQNVRSGSNESSEKATKVTFDSEDDFSGSNNKAIDEFGDQKYPIRPSNVSKPASNGPSWLPDWLKWSRRQGEKVNDTSIVRSSPSVYN